MKVLSIVFIFLILTTFLFAKTIESNYFSLVCEETCNLVELAKKLDVNYFLHLNKDSADTLDLETVIKNALDSLFLEISDILDIKIYSYKSKIKIFSSKQNLKRFLLQQNINLELPSIYIPEHNTIYITEEELNVGMLSHEIAHSIICKYFFVPPPSKVQEILAGYVEYSIRKRFGKLDVKN